MKIRINHFRLGCALAIVIAVALPLTVFAGTTREITLQSNENCDFYVDGEMVTRGRVKRVEISKKDEHTLLCKPDGYVAKTQYIQPPYSKGMKVGFVFLIEDREGYDRKAALKKIYPTLYGDESPGGGEGVITKSFAELSENILAQFVDRLPDDKTIAVTGFVKRDCTCIVNFSEQIESTTEDLLVKQNLRVVERSRLEVATKEYALWQSGLVDAEAVSHIGNMVKADIIIFGEINDDPAHGVINIKAKAIDVTSGIILGSGTGELLRTDNSVKMLGASE